MTFLENALKDAFTIETDSRQGQKTLVFKNKDGACLLGFGLWYELWTRFQRPLWFGVYTEWPESVCDRFTQKNSGQFIDFEGYRICFLDSGLAEPEKAAEEIVKTLQEQLTALADE